ncbi:STAS domain-containing protein [Desulfolucanica intricata]|uniref:STAS domain-containing protein n=1 Tax=Desulfolucanica intricata TaxID=1285191 RepID=UPI00082D410D|nr:STAS domain-containing protein [Desulfolucanica intricata]
MIPILRIDDFWITSIQDTLHDQTVVWFKEDLLKKICQPDSKGLIIDLTAIEIVDSFVTKALIDIGNLSKLMGIPVIITGISPAIAITLVEMGLELQGIETALNLQKGLEKLRNITGER